jgi:hypothetical protein
MSHSPTSPPSFALLRRRIAEMVEAAGPFLEVEQAIAHSLLPAEQKTELWILAWSLLGTERQEQQIRWMSDAGLAYQQAS